MKSLIRNLALLTVIVYAAAFDCCFVITEFYVPPKEYSRFGYYSEQAHTIYWEDLGWSFLGFGLILSFLTFIIWNHRFNKLTILSINKS